MGAMVGDNSIPGAQVLWPQDVEIPAHCSMVEPLGSSALGPLEMAVCAPGPYNTKRQDYNRRAPEVGTPR